MQLLSIAAAVHAASGGAFDPSVQPLWEALARRHTGTVRGEAAVAEQADAQARTGFGAVRFDAGRVAFAKPQMALTLNGIAQGYITDRVADLLRGRGFQHVLVDLGEIRAVGAQGDGSTWPVRIAGGDRVVSLRDRALATSATLGTTFDAAGQVGHILDARAGAAVSAARQVTVSAPTAALADGLSTALCAMPQDAAPGLVRAFAGVRLEYAGV